MKPFQLNDTTRSLLNRLAEPEVSRGLTSLDESAAEQEALLACEPYLVASGATPALRQQYRWFTRELVRLLRTTPAPELPACLELLVDKWQGFGLPQKLLGLQLQAVCNRLIPSAPEPAR